ncbi:MAG: effector-associated domain EAD1-containing protein [Cyanobacteria bacterium J06648_16]
MTISWTGKNKQYLRQALIDIYTSPKKLEMFVSDELNFNLNSISTETGLEERTYDLVEDAASKGYIQKLYSCLCRQNQQNPRLVQLQEELGDTSSELTIAAAVNSSDIAEREVISQSVPATGVVREAPEEELMEPENFAHLVVAVFWQGAKNLKQLRVVPKLCYRHPGTSEIEHASLVKDEDIDKPIPLSGFPGVLRSLYDFALVKLRRDVADCGWQLFIELFLPLDVLCLPLSTWCGKDGSLFTRYCVVVGCSDRFDDNCPEALELYNQLELQWQRFTTNADVPGGGLQRLDWLDSAMAATHSLAQYNGFHCWGGWLASGAWDQLDQNTQQNWKDLIRSGVPLALWMCHGNPSRPDRQQAFDQLTVGSRFDLLMQIPAVRDVQHRSGHCSGVLYEDLTYTPERPKLPEQQLMSWPSFG